MNGVDSEVVQRPYKSTSASSSNARTTKGSDPSTSSGARSDLSYEEDIHLIYQRACEVVKCAIEPVVETPNRPRLYQPRAVTAERPTVDRKSTQGQRTTNVQKRVRLSWPTRPPNLNKPGKIAKEKRWRVDVFHDTIEFMQARCWPQWQPRRENLRFNSAELPVASDFLYRTRIVMSSEDSLDAALRLLRENRNADRADIPLVLNMANKRVRGGGVSHGARAQEEDLCRRTDLYMNLQEARYPLPEFGANYSFPVHIFRDNKHTAYQFLDSASRSVEQFPQIGVISAAAYNNPARNNVYRVNMRKKVEHLLSSCYQSGHRVLVLAPWGCGAFKNPVRDVAAICKFVIETSFKGAFKTIVFALCTDDMREPREHPFVVEFGLPLYSPNSAVKGRMV